MVCGILRPTVGQQDLAAEEPCEVRVEFREFGHISPAQAPGATPATDKRVAQTSALFALVRILQEQQFAVTEKFLLALAEPRQRAINIGEARWCL